MLAQSTSVFTEGARKTKRSKFTTTKATRTSPAIRKTAGGTRCGRKWLIHLPTIAGINRKSATTSVRRRLATARTAEINTRENRSDTMISPPLTSSTNGKAKKSNPRATKSWTVVKRRNLGIRNDFTLSLIDLRFSLLRPRWQVRLDRLRETMEDQSHTDSGNKKADNARRRVDAVRADIAYHYVGVGKDQIGCHHRQKDGGDYRSQ